MNWLRRYIKGQWRTETTSAWTEAVGEDFVETIMDWSITDDFHTKQGRSTGRLVMNHEGMVVYLKRHWQFPWWNRLLALFHPSGQWTPAAQEWKNLQIARAIGIPVPESLAMGQRVGPGLKLQSFLVIHELTGMLPLHQAIPLARSIMPSTTFTTWKKQLLTQTAEIARRLHVMHFYHKDLYLCHYYVKTPQAKDKLPGPLTLIDLHRFGQHTLNAWRWQVKDVAQLLFSTLGVVGLDESDREFILAAYRGTEHPSWLNRLFEAIVRTKAHRYALHNAEKNSMPLKAKGKAA